MAILFEIENEQHARPFFLCFMRAAGQRMRRTDDGQKMIGLLNRIGAVAEMIRAPQQTGAHGVDLPFSISPIALQARKTRFVNHTDNAFVFHSDKIDAHQIVVRQVYDAVAGDCAKRKERKSEESASEKFHRPKITIFGKRPTLNVERPILNAETESRRRLSGRGRSARWR